MVDTHLTRHLIFQWARLRNSHYFPFQFNACLNLSPFSFQQFLYIKYTPRLKKFISSKLNFKNTIYILIKDSFSTPYFPLHCWHYGNGRLTFQSWFFAIAHYLTFYVVNSYQSNKRVNQSFDFTGKNYIFSRSRRKNVSPDNFLEFVLPPVACGFNVHFMQKHRKWTARLPLSAGCFLIAQAGFFICYTTTVGLCRDVIILLKFHVPSRDFFLQSFAKFHCLRKC